MKPVALKLTVVALFLTFLGVAIAATESESLLTIWLLLFVFVGIPLLLVSIADFVRLFRGADSDDSFFSTGVHVTAVFAFAIGYLLSKMAIWADHPSQDKHAYLPFIFVALVYGYPLFMWLKARATAIFFGAIQTEEELDSHVLEPLDPDAGPDD